MTAADTTPDATEASTDLLPAGTTLNDLRVDAYVGGGAQGQVYAVTSVDGRREAVKVLSSELVESGTVLARLEREARAAASISHENVTQIHGLERTPEGRAFIRMELLEGISLNHLLATTRLDVELACSFAEQMAAGLGAAHALGIIHRDVKPGNVFIANTPYGQRVKLMDFGIAKVTRDEDLTVLTHTGCLVGTPAYMSPEQILLPSEMDHRSDIYALGLVFYEMLCGRRPFSAPQVGQLLMMHVHSPAPRPEEIDPRVSAELSDLVTRCLAKRPESRFASTRAFVSALQEAREAKTLPPRTSSPAAPPEIPVPRPTPTSRWPLFVAMIALPVIGLTGWQWLERQPGSSPTTVAVNLRSAGVLMLDSEPSGAAVFLGETILGATPLQLDLAANTDHRLVLRREGYDSRGVVVRLLPGAEVRRKVVMARVPSPAPPPVEPIAPKRVGPKLVVQAPPREPPAPPPIRPTKTTKATKPPPVPAAPTPTPTQTYRSLDKRLRDRLARRGFDRADLAAIDRELGPEWLRWSKRLDASIDEVRFTYEVLDERVRDAKLSKAILRARLRRVLARLRTHPAALRYEPQYIRIREETEAAQGERALAAIARRIEALDRALAR